MAPELPEATRRRRLRSTHRVVFVGSEPNLREPPRQEIEDVDADVQQDAAWRQRRQKRRRRAEWPVKPAGFEDGAGLEGARAAADDEAAHEPGRRKEPAEQPRPRGCGEARPAAAIMRSASAVVAAIGFSQSTWMPALEHRAMLCSACTPAGDAMRARSGLVAATPDSDVKVAARGKVVATARRRPASGSQSATTSTSPSAARARKRGTVKALDDGAAADDRESDARPRSHRASPAATGD